MPASWLRATVAIANPRAAFIAIARPARPNSSGSPSSASLSPMPERLIPLSAAPSAEIATPTRNAARMPIQVKIATEA